MQSCRSRVSGGSGSCGQRTSAPLRTIHAYAPARCLSFFTVGVLVDRMCLYLIEFLYGTGRFRPRRARMRIVCIIRVNAHNEARSDVHYIIMFIVEHIYEYSYVHDIYIYIYETCRQSNEMYTVMNITVVSRNIFGLLFNFTHLMVFPVHLPTYSVVALVFRLLLTCLICFRVVTLYVRLIYLIGH